MADINRIHVSPGIYATETVDMKAAASSIGITKLAVVGETLKGPAFQPYWVHSPGEYASVFGGTSPKKFTGSNYPKYELPYIANEYLKKSTELCVVRTLGFSGYNAGPAWLITGEKSADNGNGKKYVIAVLRSRGDYKYRADMGKLSSDTGCPCNSAFDSLTYRVGELSSVVSCNAPISYNMDAVKLDNYYSINYDGSECTAYTLSGGTVGFDASYGDFGRFAIKCIVGPSKEGDVPGEGSVSGQTVSIAVSLNKSDKDYILNVLGTSNDDGDQPLFVESLYDVAWEDLVVNHGYDLVSQELAKFDVAYAADYGGLEPVAGILTMYESELKKKDVGKRYLYSDEVTNGSPKGMRYYVFDYDTNMPESTVVGSGRTFTESSARNSDTVLEIGEAFEITDGEYKGTYINSGVESESVRNLMMSPVFGGASTTVLVKPVSGVDVFKSSACQEGHVYTVAQITDNFGKKHYVYKAFDEEQAVAIEDESERLAAMDQLLAEAETSALSRRGSIVYNYEDGLYYKNEGDATILAEGSVSGGSASYMAVLSGETSGNLQIEDAPANVSMTTLVSGESVVVKRNFDDSWTVTNGTAYSIHGLVGKHNFVVYQNENGRTVVNNKVAPVLCNLNDYKSQFRYSSTPWVVSNAKGDANNIEVNKLFRFHTISDGTGSVSEVKVSIENIRPDSGEFDVIVRPYNDGDSNVTVLERFTKCTMVHGKKFIGYQIGTIDGVYESKSKYITVEVNDTTAAKNSVPAGFIGYPVPVYNGTTISADGDGNKKVFIAPIAYNKEYDEDVAKRKQYFGISDRTGYDYDYFTFKGKMATLEDPGFVSHGFHLDCRMDETSYGKGSNAPKITVDGVEGYVFDTVSVNARTSSLTNTPIIASEADMEGSIFEDIKLRKFTMVFAGGFDGWDIYRDKRTNTDDFSATTYKGYISTSTGVGYSFNAHNDASSYGIEGRAITSDYYSTLAGVSLLKNPEETDINLLATPGIDTVNNTKLVSEVFDILEDRADTFYIVTTPDKDSGAGDYAEDIPEVDEIVSDFSDKELYSDYAATYYPWVKIDDGGEYVWLPATRDVVRNLAESDNTNTTMNLAPAGTTRGKVDAIRARKNLKNGESDELYEANINPVRTYAQEGIVIMGQKTLRQEDDLMNRVDVRRMVLRLRKLIAVGCLGLIFEPNDNSTVKAFKSIISGIMQSFVDNRAIEKWTMNVDDSQEARDRLELGATIIIKPVRALEYITLNFVVTNNDVYFES